jgi:hypothetical protein
MQRLEYVQVTVPFRATLATAGLNWLPDVAATETAAGGTPTVTFTVAVLVTEPIVPVAVIVVVPNVTPVTTPAGVTLAVPEWQAAHMELASEDAAGGLYTTHGWHVRDDRGRQRVLVTLHLDRGSFEQVAGLFHSEAEAEAALQAYGDFEWLWSARLGVRRRCAVYGRYPL